MIRTKETRKDYRTLTDCAVYNYAAEHVQELSKLVERLNPSSRADLVKIAVTVNNLLKEVE